jgi:hypothetical protein
MAKNLPNKIPGPNVVKGPKPVLSEDNPDTLWLSPDEYLKIKAGSLSYNNYLSSISASSPSQVQSPVSNLVSPNLFADEVLKPDTVDLTDIESITYEQYYDSVSKLIKYKAIIKIRNSSATKEDIQGVDARIYNPNA